MTLTLTATNLKHRFGRQTLFNNLSFSSETGEVLLVTGPNGSGKSTLLKILAGFLTPLQGTVSITRGDRTFTPRDMFHRIGMCTPEMQLYEELSGMENVLFFSRLRGLSTDIEELAALFEESGIGKARHKLVKAYSSGMKQRLKLILCHIHRPAVVYLDEPGSNLDEEGHSLVRDIIEKERERSLVVLATNDPREMSYGTQTVDVAE